MALSLTPVAGDQLDSWDAMYASAHRPAVSQSRYYAEALASARGWLSDFYLVQDGDEVLGGCVVQTKHQPIGKAMRIERGPIWTKQPTDGQQLDVLTQLADMTKPRWFERRRFYPDLPNNGAVAGALPSLGFKRVDIGYRTIWLKLEQPQAVRRTALRQNWRHALAKAERPGLTIQIDDRGEHLSWLTAHHEHAMRRQHFIGPTSLFLGALKSQAANTGDFLIFRAHYLGKPIAGALMLRHGPAATYLVGWSGKIGRKYNAQHLLLWQAISHLQDKGVQYLDLGGVNPEGAKGVTYFKRGLLTPADEEATGAPIYR
ncbi:MAG: GNAT family N-acetyltransferase [Alphaproteobacteria bacterium]|nr:GNAT family N-acetyltransferase [Alphaproteobacteria bacterium SS10]